MLTVTNGIYNNISNTFAQLNYPETTANDSGLLPDTSYNYIVTPYNNIDLSGTSVILGPKYTLGQIDSAAFDTVTDTSIAIKNITGVYYYVKVFKNGSPINNPDIYYPLTTCIDSSELIPNNQYTYIKNRKFNK